MVKSFNRIFKSLLRPRFTLLSLFIVLFASTWANAAQLRDIRVGEYKSYTRIVFELDSPIGNPEIKPQKSGQLSVSFKNTKANLKRKIPVERSRHVEAIQIWQRKDKLSIVLNFGYNHFRVESSAFKSPPRIAVDVFPLSEAPEKDKPYARPPVEPDPKDAGPEDIDETPKEVPVQTTIKSDTTTAPAPMPLVEKDDNKPDRRTSEVVEPQKKPHSESISPVNITKDDAYKSPKKRGRIQLYLVIALVIMTIIILTLLLLMLLTSQRLSAKKKSLDTNELLNRQDKEIASLDTQINEQLKEFDDA